MTDCPDTFDELDDLWAGTTGPTEHTPTIHPSMLPQAHTTLVRHAWLDIQIDRRRDGAYEVRDEGRSWCIVVPDEVMALGLFKGASLGQMRAIPRAECQGQTPADHCGHGDPLAFFRGLGWALLISAPFWFATAYVVLRWRGVL